MSLAVALALAMADAESSGVLLDAVHDGECIWISSIERDGGPPGSGALVLQSLMEIADDHGLPLRAAVVRDHHRLLEYYETLGFEAVSHEKRAEGRNYSITIEYAP